jgi:hypothetical protein
VKKELKNKLILISMLTLVLTLTACSGAIYGKNKGCSEEDFCSYYTGTRGIITQLENPQPYLFYRSSEAGQLDANYVDFNVRLRNDGPSDSYGAVFFSGVGAETFRITRIDSAGSREVMVPRTRQACYIDLFNVQDITDPFTWNFMANCFGAEYSQIGDRSRLNLGFAQIAENFGEVPRWLQMLADNNINLGLEWRDGEMSQFNIGADFGLIRYGRSLMLIISGLNFEAFGGMPFYLQGDNPDYPSGEIDFKTFRLQLRGVWPAGQDYYTIPYSIKTCYAYTTFVSPMICIDPDPFSDESKVCNDFTHTWSGSQGAPVAVTRLSTQNTGKEVLIQATIKNVGIGDVWDVGYLEYCSPYFPATVTPTMKDIVYIGHMHIENRPLDCSSSFRLRLDPRTKEARLTCRYDLVNTGYVGSAYSAPLRMELWYGYEEKIDRTITVRKLN